MAKKIISFVLVAFLGAFVVLGLRKLTTGSESAFSKKTEIDLTGLSNTVVYAELFNMLTEPARYEGKKITMTGAFDAVEFEVDGVSQQLFACVVQDTAACCTQGMEFVLAGSPSYPEGYPKVGSEIKIRGTYHHFMQDGYDRILLKDAELLPTTEEDSEKNA